MTELAQSFSNLPDYFVFRHLGLSLIAGLIIGLERGWEHREKPDLELLAGIRTFTLAGLFGGVSALLAQVLGILFLAVAFVAVAGLIVSTRFLAAKRGSEIHTSTQLALMLTFSLGVLAMQADLASESAAIAVIVAVILSLKRYLDGWLKALSVEEMRAVLWMLTISVVALPLLPNQGYGPWSALNPYQIWWMVVLIAGISFTGYFAMRVAGTETGILLTGLIGGLVSSTALTLHFSRLGQSGRVLGWLSAGILIASGTMFFRVVAIVAAINRELAMLMAGPMLITGVMTCLFAVALWFRQRHAAPSDGPPVGNPLNLRTAFKFAFFLSCIMLLSKAAYTRFGDTGLYVVSLISGITDVDPITLSTSQMAGQGVAYTTAAWAIIIACATNTVVKGAMVIVIGGLRMGLYVLLPLLISLGVGALTIALSV